MELNDFTLAIIKVLILSCLAFFTTLFLTPILTKFLYKYKMGKNIRSGGDTPIFSKLHQSKAGTPTMGGILVWGTTLFFISFFWFFDRILKIEAFHFFNFLTRKETLLPLGAFLGASLIGLFDDWLDVRRMGHNGRGLRFRTKIFLYIFIAIIGAWWFYFKIDFSSVYVPFYGQLEMGPWFIPFFIFVVIATGFSVNQTDGLDGLAGGILLMNFSVFLFVSFVVGRVNLASLLSVVCGGLLAFLWFNVHPARFFMGDTGSMGMGTLLAVVAFLTNSVYLLPVIGFVFVAEGVTTIIQILSKKIFGKKIFLAAPIHHHFQAYGWPETKVTMRFWIISAICFMFSIVLFFVA